jgi:hypothetical protein
MPLKNETLTFFRNITFGLEFARFRGSADNVNGTAT